MSIECITVDTPYGFIYLTSNDTDVAKKQIMIFEPDAETRAVIIKLVEHCDHIVKRDEKWVDLYGSHGQLLTVLPIVTRHGKVFP